MGLIRALVCLACLIAPAGAVADQPADRVIMLWRDAAKAAGATEGAIAVLRDGRALRSAGIGETTANTPLPVMSLSKAITGSCILALEKEGLLSFGDPVGAYLPEHLAPRGAAGRTITIAALLTQSGGLHRDATQGIFSGVHWGNANHLERVTLQALSRRRGDKRYFYNNENYAILGEVIEAVTDSTANDACADRVLKDMKSPRPSADYANSLSYAGWAISMKDYVSFLADTKWPSGEPQVETEHGTRYGAGVEAAEINGKGFRWHFGHYCWRGRNGLTAAFYHLPGEFTVVWQLNRCILGDDFDELDQEVYWVIDELAYASSRK